MPVDAIMRMADRVDHAICPFSTFADGLGLGIEGGYHAFASDTAQVSPYATF